MKRVNVLLWVVQGLLAALFLFAGGIKLVLPLEALTAGPVPLPGLFMRFIGVAEVLGAFGLICPGLFRIKQVLTPLAAGGLTLIMVGATAVTLIGGDLVPALVPAIAGSLAILVARGRTRSRMGRTLRVDGNGKATPVSAVA